MLFTRVIFSTFEFFQESFAIAKSTRVLFMSKKWPKIKRVYKVCNISKRFKLTSFELNSLSCLYFNSNGYFNSNSCTKRTFFHIPPTENHSFQNCFFTVHSYFSIFNVIEKIRVNQ